MVGYFNIFMKEFVIQALLIFKAY